MGKEFLGKYSIYYGTNGKILRDVISRDSDFYVNGSQYTDGALGSAHSWYRLLNVIKDDHAPRIVLEDDACVNKDSIKHSKGLIDRTSQNFDVLYLTHNSNTLCVTEPYQGQVVTQVSYNQYPDIDNIKAFQNQDIGCGYQKLITTFGIS